MQNLRKLSLSFCLLFLLLTESIAQTEISRSGAVYQAYITNNTKTFDSLIAIQREEYYQKKDPQKLFELTWTIYSQMLTSINYKKRDTRNLDSSLRYCIKLFEVYPQKAPVYSLYSGLLGILLFEDFRNNIGYVTLSYDNALKALSLDSTLAMAHYNYGTGKLAPPQFGGDKAKGLGHLQTAISLFEKSGKTDTWEYLEAATWLATAYKLNGEPAKGKALLEKLVTQEPNFRYAKEILLPGFSK